MALSRRCRRLPATAARTRCATTCCNAAIKPGHRRHTARWKRPRRFVGHARRVGVRLWSIVASLSVLGAAITGCTAPSESGAPQRLTPPMGWNSWNSGIPLTEQTVKATIDAMVSSGMRDAGYHYVNLDAGWAAPTRGPDAKL